MSIPIVSIGIGGIGLAYEFGFVDKLKNKIMSR